MSLFVTSTSAATRHDVYAIKATPTPQIRAGGTGRVGYVAQFPWGPERERYLAPDIGTAKKLFAPPGMSRTGYGYLGLLARAYPELVIVRATNDSAAKATCALTVAGPTTKVTLTAKYKGVAGNSMTATVSDATDGDANHFNLTVTVTSASGTTSDVLKNINFSGTGADSTFTQEQLDALQLIGVPVKTAAGRPDNVVAKAFSAGADGSISGADYVGTAGTGNKGLTILEGDPAISHVFTDYPGSGLIATVNAGLVAHRVLMGDRCVYMNGIPAQSLSDVATDVALYRDAGTEYVDPWAYIYDDTTGALQLVPPAGFEASVAAQLSPSTSAAWKATEVQAMLSGIVKLETDRGAGAGSNTAQGITTLIKEQSGGHTFEAAVNTIATTDPTQEDHTTTRMDQYIAKAFVRSLRGSVDAPNVPQNRDDIVLALDRFMSGLKRAQTGDPNHTPHVMDYAIPPLDAANTATSLAAGDVFIQLAVQYSTGMKRIFLIMKSGTGALTITPQA